MEHQTPTPRQKPYDIHERLFLFACEIVRTTQFLHIHSLVGRALSYQILDAGLSIGANAQEADGASSRNDFIAKFRIALKEAKETSFRLRVCRACDLLDERFASTIAESNELVRIIGAIVHKASRRRTRDELLRTRSRGGKPAKDR